MRSQNKNPKTTSRQSKIKRNNGIRSGDVSSQVLQKISGKMGNSSLQDQINQRGNHRDQLLSFIVHRLQNIRDVQRIEVDQMKNKEQWFRNVAKGEKGAHLPQPTRWHEAAKLFKRAAQMMCQGNLSRGKELLNQALEQEEAAYDSLPNMVADRLNENQRSGDNAPIGLSQDDPDVCPSTRIPQQISIADQILNVRDTMENVSPIKKTRPFTWWADQQEDEEEDSKEEITQEKSEKETQEQDVNREQIEAIEKEQRSTEQEYNGTDKQ